MKKYIICFEGTNEFEISCLELEEVKRDVTAKNRHLKDGKNGYRIYALGELLHVVKDNENDIAHGRTRNFYSNEISVF